MKKTKSKGECNKSKTAFSMWYTNADTLHILKIRKKHQCWQRYIEMRSGQKFTENRRLSNQVKDLTKKAKKHKERSIAKEAKRNPKKFWKYVNGKTRIRQGMPNLAYYGENGEVKSTTNDKEKTRVQSSFFMRKIWKIYLRHHLKSLMLY